jgi:hypothetical protein
MNQAETYFQDLAPLSHASQVGATHERVAPVHIAQLMGVGAWAGVDVAPHQPESRRLLGGVTIHESRQPLWRDSLAEYASPPFLFLPPLFLSSFLLLYSPHGSSIGDFKFSQ